MSLALFSDAGQEAVQDCDSRQKGNGRAGLQASAQALEARAAGQQEEETHPGAQGHRGSRNIGARRPHPARQNTETGFTLPPERKQTEYGKLWLSRPWTSGREGQ